MVKLSNNEYKIQLYTTSLMLMVSSADERIDESELKIIKEILIDYFKINMELSEKLILDSYKLIEESTDIYEIASFINNSLNNQEKIDLLCCIFEVAYSDKELHFMERHLINQIANILNINKDKMLKVKKEMQNYLL